MRQPRKSRRWLAISLGVAILAGWLVYAGLFVSRLKQGRQQVLAPEIKELSSEEPREEWLAIYQHGRRAGYSHTKLRPSAAGYGLTEELFLRLDFLGQTQDVVSRVEAQLARDFSLRSFSFRLKGGPVIFRLRGNVQDGKLILVTWMAGQQQKHQLPLPGPIYLGSAIESFLVHRGLQVGRTYHLTLFDPATLSRTVVPLKVEARETVAIHGRQQPAFRVAMDFHGVRLRSWISPYGEVLKEEGFLGMTLVKSDAADALEGLSRTAAVELVQEAAVTPDRSIPRPRQLKWLRLQLAGMSGSGWNLAGGRQKWHQGELTVVRESLRNLPSSRIPCRDPEMARDLQPTILIQSQAPQLKRLAAEIVGSDRDGLRAAERICSWVYRNLEKRPTLSVPNALEVLKRRSGDCNEHSVLFAALARAAGLPTRLAAGLLYADGRFYYHAWNEVYLGRWVAVDSLMNQVPADPTHIRLLLGGLERQVQLVRVIGRLHIRVLGYG